MKRLNYISVLILMACFQMLISCSEETHAPNGYIESTVEGSSVCILKGYENPADGFTLFKPEGFESSFYIKDQMFTGGAFRFIKTTDQSLSAMKEPVDGWQSNVEIKERTTYWARYASFTEFKYIKFRVAFIEGNEVGMEYVVTRTAVRPNANANTSATVYATNWEIPALNADNRFVAHDLTVGKDHILNFAYEWNAGMKHAEWVSFYFDAITCKDVTKRTDAWDVDPSLPADLQTSQASHANDGFDRGHICASEDRVWSVAANKQTFYYSNISPQLASFNQGFWVGIEAQIRKWGRAIPLTYDKVYITKGGTLNHLLKNFTGTIAGSDKKNPTTDEKGFTVKGLACPQYYFAAILSEKKGVYHAIAFLVEHKEGLPKNPTTKEMQQYVVSIDELEAFSGIDFFCNLPDDLENQVESSYSLSAWDW